MVHQQGDILEVTIEGLGSFGEGLGRVQNTEIFVPKTARGDKIECQLLEQKKGRWRARLVRLIEPGPSRVQAPCKHFDACGGCDFQHLANDEQRAWKMRIIKHWIRRSPLAPQLESIIFDQITSPHAYHYRHRVRLQVQDHKLHFFKPHSHDLLHLEECPILVDGFFDALSDRARSLGDTKNWNQSYSNHALVDDAGYYEIDGCMIRFGPDCFTQANESVNQLMWQRIKEDAVGQHFRRHALDLFCGVGNFSLPLKTMFEKVTGIENYAPAIEWAKKNSSDIEWKCMDSHDGVLEFIRDRRAVDFVLLDPPRLGALREIQALSQLMPPIIVYVSCHPETLVRDLIQLRKKSPYKIKRWTVVDLFPQTHHIESIVTLTL